MGTADPTGDVESAEADAMTWPGAAHTTTVNTSTAESRFAVTLRPCIGFSKDERPLSRACLLQNRCRAADVPSAAAMG